MRFGQIVSGRRWPAVLMLAVFFVQGLWLIRSTSPTCDEIPFHTVNGYTYLVTRDYRMNPSSPALVREWMALPWLLIRPTLNLNKSSWEKAESQPFGLEFFYMDNAHRAELLLFVSRLMILILGTLLGAVIYIWSRSIYGPQGGLLSLFFYALSPVFLAHSALATTDVGVAFTSTLAAFFLWRYFEYSKIKDIFIFSVALGFAFAAKSNMLAVGPVFLVLIGLKFGGKAVVRS